MLHTPFPLKRLSNTAIAPDSLRLIVFRILDYFFALPIEAVSNIVNCPPIDTTIQSGIGIVDVGGETITIVDLRHKFADSLQAQPSLETSNLSQLRFLILMQTRTGEPFGIPVAKPPVLTDIPSNTIRPVPLSYRQVAGLSFVSHMAIVPEAQREQPLKIFLLGMEGILANN
ncbi:MAG: chemotaxis protein CheW [Prochloraceae cyanobacterium]|nr:chemotaxis protein CheW [Prochloraceae cyanobacterium]